MKSINPCKSVVQTIYDIVKAHGGEIKVETKEDNGLAGQQSVTACIIQLPVQ